MAELSYFPLFFNQRELLTKLSGDDVKSLVLAMLDYCEHGTPLVTENLALDIAFLSLKNTAESCVSAYKKRCEVNRQNGEKGGRPKAETKSQLNPNNPQKPNETESNPNNPIKEEEKKREEESKKEKKEKESRKEEEQRNASNFERFWSAYPRKQNKVNARKAFDKLRADESVLMTMLSALENQKKTAGWLKENGAFIPHAATWLNGRRWEDVTEVETGCSQPSTYDIDAFDAFTFLDEVVEPE